ncbi:MAG: hypothetical protein WCW78_00390 [Candidatus Paceibacterota bacterium]|jgi:hypothetical protein
MLTIKGVRIYRIDADLGKTHFFSHVHPRSLSPLQKISFGKFEMEDIAMRLLTLSIEAKQWVGASFRDFVLSEQLRMRDTIRKKLPKFGYMTRVPKLPKNAEHIPTAFSGRMGAMSEISTVKGFPLSVVIGIGMLQEKGMIAISHESREDVIVPTEALILKVLKPRLLSSKL